jgi:hypothetical protein
MFSASETFKDREMFLSFFSKALRLFRNLVYWISQKKEDGRMPTNKSRLYYLNFLIQVYLSILSGLNRFPGFEKIKV